MWNFAVTEPKEPPDFKVPTRAAALKVALAYALIGALWILGSGWVLHFLVHDPARTAWLEEVKGSFFVAVTAGLLWLVLDRRFREIRRSVKRTHESEARLRLVGDNLPDSYVYEYTHAPDGQRRFLYLSAGVERVHGVTALEALRDPNRLYGQIDPTQHAARVAAEAESARGLTDFAMEFRIRRGDGQVRLVHVQARPRRDEKGRIMWDGFATDVTARKQVEAALQQSEERYRGLVETSSDWIWEVDANACYTYAGPRVTALLGYSPEEVLGRTPFDFMPREEAQRVRAIFGGIAAKHEPFSGLENTNRHKDGRLVVLETSGVPVLGSEGELRGYRGMDRDVTDRRQLEAQLRQAQKLEAIGQLAGGVAHDFNNILAAIMMNLDLLRTNPVLDEETRLRLDDLDAEAQRAANLTRQLLMFGRRSVLEMKSLDLNEVAAHLLKMLRRLIGENVDLSFEGKTALPLVQADVGMMEQVLMNLVVNARDAMPKGGKIVIRTSTIEVSDAQVKANPSRRAGHSVCLSVADTGCGMDSEILKRVFEPFFSTKQPGRGTGLGLATVHGIVAQHKGWVEIESQVNEGTTFQVFLPALTAPLPHDSRVAPAQPLRGGKETILLVEDEVNVRRLVALTLRALGYAVFEAGTGREAVALWQQHGQNVDLLLTDMVMPEGMTGLELAEKLQAAHPGLKVIISSGYSAEIAQAGVPTQAGIVYLPKPYDAKVLSRVVRKCLEPAR